MVGADAVRRQAGRSIVTTMYDAVVASNIPVDAEVAAGYIDGLYANYDAVVARTPKAQHVSITVKGAAGAMVADCEAGDLTPGQASNWANAEITALRAPVVYLSRSTYEGPYAWPDGTRFWIADWTGTPHLVPGSVATQYANNVAGCDLSLTDGIWPGQAPPPPDPREDPNMQVLIYGGSVHLFLPNADGSVSHWHQNVTGTPNWNWSYERITP